MILNNICQLRRVGSRGEESQSIRGHGSLTSKQEPKPLRYPTMKRIIITLMLAICIAGNAAGQPRVLGMHQYDDGCLYDIYQTTDGSYVACGGSPAGNRGDGWIIRTDANFQTRWSETYHISHLKSIIETEDGGFLAGAGYIHYYDYNGFNAIRTDEEGNVRWNRHYAEGACEAVIELKNGNFILIGATNPENVLSGLLVMINSDGGVIWQRSYSYDGGRCELTCGRETDGGVVVAGTSNGNHDVPWALKVDLEGRVVWSDTFMALGDREQHYHITTMVSSSDGGFLIGGQQTGDGYNDCPFIIKINDMGELQWWRRFENDQALYNGFQLSRCSENGFVFAGPLVHNVEGVPYVGAVYRLSNEGEIRWSSLVSQGLTIKFAGVIFGRNGSIVACGASESEERTIWPTHSLVVEIEPEVPGPTIGFRLPDSSTVCALPGDSIDFEIRATNQWGDEITYAFFMEDQLIAADSAVTIRFDDIGQFLVAGRAYSGGDSAEAVWQVDVRNLHVAAYSPETLKLRLRPNRRVEFSIDSFRTIGEIENIEYQWYKHSLDDMNEEDAGQDSSASVQFDEAGRYLVQGCAYRGADADTVVWDVRVREGILDVDSVFNEIDSNDVNFQYATIYNDENGALSWRAFAHASGDTGFTPWTLRCDLQAGDVANDDRIEGAIFDGESYYCAGSNGDEPNLIYHLNRQGELLGSFEQPGHSRYGMKDQEWDGELIWGSGEDSVYAMTRDGEVVHRWRGPFDPTNNIAYDPEENILWLSGTVSNVVAYDCEGNNLGRSIDRQGSRIYGLGWYGDDPDSSFLYALNIPGNDSTQINKFNPLTGEMSLVHAFPLDSATGFGGAFICRNYDRYQGWVLMTVANIPMASGGDALRVYQLEPNREWLTVHPESGAIPPGESVEVEIRVRTAGWDGSWAFEVGEYEGEIVFEHNGQGGRDVLPVHLRVVEPNEVAQDGYGNPSSFELFTAYPNPFNSTTRITYILPQAGYATLRLYNLSGREVARLVDGVLPAGTYSAEVNAVNLPSGLYFARLSSAGKAQTVKLMLVK